MKDGNATRRRLLDAAAAEFAAYGIAGARVDRISANAKANKAQLYAYFGDKDRLFDAVFQEQADELVNVVPFSADDLPGYALALYDACLTRPNLVRLATWARLERVPAGALVTSMPEQAERKLAAISDMQRAGRIDPALAPEDVLAMVSMFALTWSPASLFHTATQADPEADHERRRQALAEAVRRAFSPPEGTAATGRS
ncbi:transcriptional regulator, TetR family [Lentzea xinjiangensis]|uniref:Transcriptional regulator, TetR family n=1 Tax=Lentzea xinjiangensis TaxID=402600 RepID=A0A1H9QFE4_9PSEU|nr:TetR family transcriptional regulator [Lentzea xinjiangensis]SER59162.1 transcriptional regulator, TetR family [Lentzea xinjiangensis]